MTSHTKKRSAKAGLPPGALVHIGEKKAATSSVTLLDYDESDVRESVITAADLADKVGAARGTVWLNLHGLGDTAMLEQIGASFGLHRWYWKTYSTPSSAQNWKTTVIISMWC